MAAKKSSQVEILFENLVKLLKNQQQQLESLVEERKLLEDRIKAQQERWVSDVCLCKDQISQMEDSLTEKDLANSLLEMKSALMIAMKHREASLLKLKLEQTEDELIDFRAGFDYLSRTLEKNSPKTDNEKEDGGRSNLKSGASKKLADEIKRLKFEYEKLISEKNSEMSALLKEKSFLWNQYNILERDHTDKLKSKEAEIGNLRYKLAEMEVDRDKLKEEISKLTQELKSVKESKCTEVTPLLGKHGNVETKPPTRGAKSSLTVGSSIIVNKEFSSLKSAVPLKDGEKGSRSLKRKKVLDEVNVFETPKLFSNSFKVPKLKTPSVPVT